MENRKQKSLELEELYRQVVEYLQQQRYSFVDFGIWLRYLNGETTEPFGVLVSWSPPNDLNIGIVGEVICEPLVGQPIVYGCKDPRAFDNIKTLIDTVSRINEIWTEEKS